MISSRRLRVPILLSGVLAALLLFVASASAETRTGESSTPFAHETTDPEATIVKAAASYETTGGSIRFDVTTAAAPREDSEDKISATLATTPGECGPQTLEAIEGDLSSLVPLASILDEYDAPAALGAVITSYPPTGATPLPATRSVSGTTTTLGFISGAAVEKGFNCAIVTTVTSGGVGDIFVFPLKALPPPPPPAPPAPAPAPTLSIGKLKPLTLKAGKRRAVRVKVTNTSATATAQGSLRVKGAKGVLVKPEKQKLPALAPGSSWTLTVRVQLTAKAKKKSKLQLTGSASGAKVKGTLVVKRKGSARSHRSHR
jgi:hypothetical protein